jgi:hypothetical protein
MAETAAHLVDYVIPRVPVRQWVLLITATHPHHSALARISWARLLKRVFAIDSEQCPQCGGTLKILATIEPLP